MLVPVRLPDRLEDRALALARFFHVEVFGLPIDQFMDDECDCDSYAHDVMLLTDPAFRQRYGSR